MFREGALVKILHSHPHFWEEGQRARIIRKHEEATSAGRWVVQIIKEDLTENNRKAPRFPVRGMYSIAGRDLELINLTVPPPPVFKRHRKVLLREENI